MQNKAILMIEVGVGDGQSDELNIKCSGSPNQVLGFIARARHELAKIECSVLSDISKPKGQVNGK